MDESIDMCDLLARAWHPDDNQRSIAEGKLKQLHDLDFPNFLQRLSSELLRVGGPEGSKELAGIILKNSLDSRDPALKDSHMDLLSLQWLNLEPSIRSQIKENLLMTMESDSRLPSSQIISKVIARVACIEIPENQWLDLIEKLVDNLTRSSSLLKQATLEVLEYIFQEIPKVLKVDQVGIVLDNVINALKIEEGELSSQVPLAALKALLSVLEFVKFEDYADRNSIVAAVCDAAARSKETEIKEAAFQCLVVIASTDHTKLEPYQEIIMNLTSQALEGDVESLKVQCIKLWVTIFQEEEEEETSIFIGHLSLFVPLLLETYFKKEEENFSMSEGDDNLEDMDISMSVEEEGDENVAHEGVNLEDIWEQEGDETLQGISMTCLGLAARTMKDEVVPLVMHLVEGKINGTFDHSRKVALSPLGFILEGPSVKELAPVVNLLLDMMDDREKGVSSRAASTLGRVFEVVGSNRIMRNEAGDLRRIMNVLIERSKDVPQVYGALYFLARGYANSCELSPFVERLIEALLGASAETTSRFPACVSAYKALTEIVSASNIKDSEVYEPVFGLMSEIMRRLNTVLHSYGELVSPVERKNRGLLEVLLCGLVEVLIQKLGSSRISFRLEASAKSVLLLLCPLLTRDSTSARDAAALAIGALAHAFDGKFGQHMPILLQYFNVKRLSPVYLQVMCDICHVLAKEEEVVPYFDHIMEVLYQGILELTLQPPILSSFGHIALALGDKFEKYLPLVMEKLKEAAESAEDTDHDGKVREGIFKAYRGILEGINDPKSWLKVAMALVDFTEAEAVCSKSKTRVRMNTSVAMAGVDALSLLAPRTGAWSQGLIRLMEQGKS